MRNICEYGALGDGKSMNTEAIQRAVDACRKEGGGTVYFPAGTYLTGSIRLKSNVTLYLDAGAVLQGSGRLEDYHLRHLLYAENEENIAVTGDGCIDGQGTAFWEPGHELRPENIWRKGWGEVTHYYSKTLPRPERLIRFSGCKKVRVENVELRNSPSWTLHLLACEDVAVQGIRITNPLGGPNTDGIDIDGSQNVLVSDCRIITGDDAIVIKNTGIDGWKKPVRNVTVTNCILTTPCNAFKIGTETQADIENVVFSNSVVYSDSSRDCYDRAISGISIEMVDGANLSGVLVSGILIRNARSPIFIRLGNRGRGQAVPKAGTLRDVAISSVQAFGAILPCIISGIEEASIERVSLSNIQMCFAGGGNAVPTPEEIPDLPAEYPEAVMFGRWLPSYGLFCRRVKELSLQNIHIRLEGEDSRKAVRLEQTEKVSMTQCIVDGKEL